MTEPKKQFTFDEWIFHYLANENKLGEMILFLEKMLTICDKFVFKESTPLAYKLYLLQKERSLATPKINKAIGFFIKSIFGNLEKKHSINEITSISEENKSLLPRKDIYLVEMALTTTSKILISTDKKLIESINNNEQIFGVTACHADQFIADYINS